MTLTIHHIHSGDPEIVAQLQAINKHLAEMRESIEDLKRMDQQTQDLLTKLDAETNQLATNLGVIGTGVGTIGTVAGTIKTEVEALLLQIKGGATPADVVLALQGLSIKAQGISDTSDAAVTALNAQIPVLQAIAAEGAPVVPAAPAPPTIK